MLINLNHSKTYRKTIMIKNIFLLGAFLMIGCESKPKVIHVEIHGALKEIMHDGAREGVVALSDITNQEHIYGLGALEGLDGEILIWDSKAILTRAQKEGKAHVSTEAHGEKALLLVSTQVKEWIDISFNSKDLKESLNDYIYDQAKKNKLNPEEPFPFIIDGEIDKIKWHIISDPGLDGTHDDHMNKSWNQTDSNINGQVLGFYSVKHHAIFTHHTTNSHMHYYDEKSGLSGHVDELELGKNIILRLPK
ncbi:MAG: hypothetical protein HN657_00585 [Candidatus Marinimicrobia bacterium]|jgi:acetolactate decarboxylase|nr:hypothetical protein [Candidatus Neomarinimicrobiota bacterium]MBT5404344.1 hypothetical protein [Candidatus Neomarinimicrobiota bacterium]MBT7512694.1 hypothetical protein [Candidatus Neomarinimicrobiota bacterium]